MNKRIWKLYKEVCRLRRKVKQLEIEDAFSKHALSVLRQEVQTWRQYIGENHPQLPYDKIMLTVPNMYGFETIIDPRYADREPRAEYLMKRMTDTAKLKLIDDLIQGGYIKKVRDDEACEMYEVKVIR